MSILSSVDFWKFAIPLLGAVVAWFFNEWRKQQAEQHTRKEESYKQLLRSLQGFYIGAVKAEELKSEFLNQMNIAWLYCPDHVIRAGYKFLDTVQTGKTSSDDEKETALGAFVEAIRKDHLSWGLVKRTELSARDFRHLGVSNLYHGPE